jgi:aquaporin NIP
MRRFVAESLGTFILVLAGTGAMVVNEVSHGAIGHVGVALTFGLVVLAMIHALGDVTGAHLNPAVTLALFVRRDLPKAHVLPYLSAQCLGAVLASGTLRLLFPQAVDLGATVPSGSAMQSFVLETILTFILMLTILRASTNRNEASLAIGAVIGLGALFAGPISGASMNPARSLGPALISGQLTHLWIYLSAPVLGALLAIPVAGFLKPSHS